MCDLKNYSRNLYTGTRVSKNESLQNKTHWTISGLPHREYKLLQESIPPKFN